MVRQLRPHNGFPLKMRRSGQILFQLQAGVYARVIPAAAEHLVSHFLQSLAAGVAPLLQGDIKGTLGANVGAGLRQFLRHELESAVLPMRAGQLHPGKHLAF